MQAYTEVYPLRVHSNILQANEAVIRHSEAENTSDSQLI